MLATREMDGRLGETKYNEPIDFEDSLRKGKAWEYILKETIGYLPFVKFADYNDPHGRRLQTSGIDLILDGIPINIEVKTRNPTYYNPKDPDIWLETWSVPGKKRGWYYTSTADAIFYHWAKEDSPKSSDAFIFNLKKLRERKFLEDCIRELQLEEKIARPTNYNGSIYSSTGYPIPISRFPEDTIINVMPLVRQHKLDELNLLEAKKRFHSVFDNPKKG